jgi:hypothetical protein
MYAHCGYTLLWSAQPLPLLSLTLYLLHPSFQQLSIHIPISSTFTDAMFYNITDALSFSFPFPLSLSPIEKSHCYTHVLHWVCIWSCLFLCLYVYLLDLCSRYERKCGLCVCEPGLLHLTWCPPTASRAMLIIVNLHTHHQTANFWTQEAHVLYLGCFTTCGPPRANQDMTAVCTSGWEPGCTPTPSRTPLENRVGGPLPRLQIQTPGMWAQEFVVFFGLNFFGWFWWEPSFEMPACSHDRSVNP